MIFSQKEIEQLNNLLLSEDDNNKVIALGLIKNAPENIPTLKYALCITAYMASHVREHIEAEAHYMLEAALSEAALNELQNHIIILDYAQYKFKVAEGWNTYQNPLRKYLDIHIQAIDHYLELFKINPEPYAQIYTILANRIQKEWKNHHRALYFYEKAMLLNPHNTQAHFGFALIMHVYYIKKGERLEEVDRVLQYYMDAYKSPKNINAYRNAAMLCKDIGDIDRAEFYYLEGLSECPDDTLLLNNYANLLMKNKKDFAAAKKVAQKGLDLTPKDASLLDTMAHIEFLGYQNYGLAKLLFEKALKRDGDHHYSYTGLGDMYLMMGNYALAEHYYLKGLHNGLQYTSREVFEIVEKLEKLVAFYRIHLNNHPKVDYYQMKLARLKRWAK